MSSNLAAQEEQNGYKKTQVRQAVLTDLDALSALEAESFDTPWSRETLRNNIENSQDWAKVLLIEEDGEVEAYIISNLVLDEVEILRIAVSENFRRQGLAKTLIQEVLAQAKTHNANKIILEVNEKNYPAINLYKNTGFYKVGERPAYYNIEDSAILMDLDLN